MSHSYLSKSKDTYNSGEILRSKDMHNSSIHCYYYSCMQLCNHVIAVTESLSDKEIRELFRTAESHNETINRIVKKAGLSTRKALTVNLSTLKNNRQIADYRNLSLGEPQSEESKDLCIEITECLNRLL
ncbi:hypothetical protein [Chryseobacterium sp. AG844]|uniref:hypothetical protein n=1 Tax=Chryseobacterium sp. AG844 TaxID=2183998 RepID=UPI000D821B60|nr:hypothetical protein [Chryseobacterium sp. AG844]PWW25397.1 hypothetical protein DEU40_112129 [Chryseobacterium sp. AG844]